MAMYLHRLRYIASVIILLQGGDVQALPSVEFIRDLWWPITDQVLSYMFLMTYQFKIVWSDRPIFACTLIYKFISMHCYTTIRSKKLAPVKTAVRFQGSELFRNDTFFDEDLHVFIVDHDDVKQSIKTFANLYSLRTRKSREFWLVDISSWTYKFRHLFGKYLWLLHLFGNHILFRISK